MNIRRLDRFFARIMGLGVGYNVHREDQTGGRLVDAAVEDE